MVSVHGFVEAAQHAVGVGTDSSAVENVIRSIFLEEPSKLQYGRATDVFFLSFFSVALCPSSNTNAVLGRSRSFARECKSSRRLPRVMYTYILRAV